MLVDDAGFDLPLADAAATVRRLEELGYAGLWTAETKHDPFLPLAAAAAAGGPLTLGTAIATAFTRSPMVTAMVAWDLQRASGGRFVLGLGTQVRGHNVRRFSVSWERPAPRLAELVRALRHVWGAFQGEHPLSFRGEFYRLDLMTPFFDPGPIEHPRIPIFLAAVTPRMYRLAGELADGVHVHPFHSVRYLRETALPALAEGLARSGRSRGDLQLAVPVVCVVGGDEEARRFARLQIGFYASTKLYRPVLEAHGAGELQERLARLVAAGDFDGVGEAIGPELLAELAVEARDWEQAAEAIRERYDGLADRVSLYAPPNAPRGDELRRFVDLLSR